MIMYLEVTHHSFLEAQTLMWDEKDHRLFFILLSIDLPPIIVLRIHEWQRQGQQAEQPWPGKQEQPIPSTKPISISHFFFFLFTRLFTPFLLYRDRSRSA